MLEKKHYRFRLYSASQFKNTKGNEFLPLIKRTAAFCIGHIGTENDTSPEAPSFGL